MISNKSKSLKKDLIAEKFGSRRGFIRSCKYGLLYRLGQYRSYQNIDWTKIDRLVFVCKGNICRSSFAEAVARHGGADAVSCGIHAIDGASANENAIRTAHELDYSLELHKTRPIQSLIFRKNDLLVAVEPWQLQFLEEHLGVRYRCTLLGLWLDSPRPYIHDPYGGNIDYFKNCFYLIEKSVKEIVKNMSNSK